MVFKENFYVGYSDVGKDFRLSDSSVLKLFEDVACMHSTSVGDGMKTSASRWFLKAYHVKIHKRPEQEERITACTWSRSTKGVSASREFEIYSQDGSLAVTGISNWVRVNAESFKPERVAPELMELYGSETERTNFDSPWIDKLKEPETYSIEKEFYIDRNFIDANNHMNNVFYLDLAELVLPEEIYEKGDADEFEIMFRKGIGYGETVKCFYTEAADSYIVTVKSADLSECHAIIKLYK